MEAKDVFQRGDVFTNDYQELTVVGFGMDGEKVKVENLAGMTEWMEPRELIQVTQR